MFRNGRNGQNVVSMNGRDMDQRTAPLREVEAYWHALCGTDQVPLRSQIDPRGIEGALEYAFLAERISPRLAKLRVAGSHLGDLMGMEVAGMPVSALFAPVDRARLADAIEALFETPAVLRLQLRAQGGLGLSGIEGTLLLLPLRSDFGDISRALGCLVTQGRIGRTPRRFEITGVTLRPALDPGGVEPQTQQTQRHLPPCPSAPARHLSEEAAPFDAASGKTAPERPGSAKAPHLRVVASNDS